MKDQHHAGGQAGFASAFHRIKLRKIQAHTVSCSIRTAILKIGRVDHLLCRFCHLTNGSSGARGSNCSLIGVTARFEDKCLLLRRLPQGENAADLDPVAPVANRYFKNYRGSGFEFMTTGRKRTECGIRGNEEIALVGPLQVLRCVQRAPWLRNP